MKSLFVKEWRQSYLLPWSGFLLSAMISVLYWAWSRRFVESVRDERDLNLFCATLAFVSVGAFLVVATASAFPSEKTRGTLPYLLALPVSRNRIWLAKALGALTLAGAAALLLWVPLWVVVPQTIRELDPWPYLPDMLCFGLLLFSVTVFFSTVLERTVSVLLATLLVGGLPFAGALLLVASGGSLLGYDDLLDAGLWALVLSPGFLAASWLAFARGELLQGPRKWLLALPALAVVLAITAGGVAGATRYAFRYQRSAVEDLSASSIPDGGAVAALTVRADPAPFVRSSGRGWDRTQGPYRSTHTVAVDLGTGRDLLVRRGAAAAEPSPDGRHLALLPGPRQLTWSRADQDNPPMSGWLEIWDLETKRLVQRGRLDSIVGGRQASPYELRWSRDGRWLGLRVGYMKTIGNPPDAEGRDDLLAMRPDGSGVAVIQSRPTPGMSASMMPPDRIGSWDIVDDCAYALETQGRLLRRRLPEGRSEVLWETSESEVMPTLPEGHQWRFVDLSVSPGGRWIAMRGYSYGRPTSTSQETTPEMPAVVVIAADGTGVATVASVPAMRLLWSPDGRTLYVIARNDGRPQVGIWREGDREAPFFDAPPGEPANVWAVVPRDDGVVVWDQPQRQNQGAVERTHVYLVNLEGRFVPLPHRALRRLPSESSPLGADSQGRLVVRTWDSELVAADVSTGKITTIYP